MRDRTMTDREKLHARNQYSKRELAVHNALNHWLQNAMSELARFESKGVIAAEDASAIAAQLEAAVKSVFSRWQRGRPEI